MAKQKTNIASSLSSTIKLNDGVVMPLFGLGVYMASSGQGGKAEKADTNEADVGRGIKNSQQKRDNLFVVTKLWGNGYETCKLAFEKSFKMLDIGYIDLYLIHSPTTGKIVETYKAMLELIQEGKVSSVGVSNFEVQHLEGLKKSGLPTPSVNQLELHPWQQKSDIVDYCRQNGITVMGYSPLTRGGKLSDTTLTKIANRHNKTPAQILIRWSVEQGFITLSKSVDPTRIEQNCDVFD